MTFITTKKRQVMCFFTSVAERPVGPQVFCVKIINIIFYDWVNYCPSISIELLIFYLVPYVRFNHYEYCSFQSSVINKWENSLALCCIFTYITIIYIVYRISRNYHWTSKLKHDASSDHVGIIPQLSNSVVTCRRVHVAIVTGSTSDDWIYWHFGYNLSWLQLIQLVLTNHTALSLIYTLSSSPLHTH
jgi:hypothetical protein